MLVQKYPYKKITRESVNGVRLYSCPNGEKLPSVTTVLSATKPAKAQKALTEWKKRVGHKNAELITKEAATRGTRMHAFLETYMKEGTTGEPGTNPYSKEGYKMACHVIEQSLHKVSEFYGSEVSLYYPELYAGATDSIALYDNQISILDFKQTNKPKRREWVDDYMLQLAAYIEAHNKVYGTDIKQGIIMMCSPALNYQQWILAGDELEHYKELWWGRLHEYYSKLGG